MPRIKGIIADAIRNHLLPKMAIFSPKSKNKGTFSGDLKITKIKHIIKLKTIKKVVFKSNFLSIIKE